MISVTKLLKVEDHLQLTIVGETKIQNRECVNVNNITLNVTRDYSSFDISAWFNIRKPLKWLGQSIYSHSFRVASQIGRYGSARLMSSREADATLKWFFRCFLFVR